ncbi:MAG: type IV toxin-antitoxin system AbiEi family antitoxin domain-containing protein [Anaerolineales bacterium]|nr:type IV toxin-antitoxin system AbiEi family antitoxin domain-containing protein [Anaerolineales bacterium]
MVDQPDFNRLYEIAENQAGYFTAKQAHLAGFSRERLFYYVTTGRFSRVQRGIYRLVQFPGSPYEDLFVAWLKAGPDAVISHESALYLYQLSDVLPSEIHVIMPRTGSRRRQGIRLHTNRLNPNEVTQREGLPVTSATRTIIDVAAGGITDEQIRKAIHEAIRRGLIAKEELLSLASRHGGRLLRIIEKSFNSEFE